MAGFFSRLRERQKKKGHVDYLVLFLTIGIIAFGLVMLFSASFYYGLNRYGDGYHYVKRQLLGVLLGGAAMFVLSRVDYHVWLRHWKAIYAAGLVVLALVWVPGFGVSSNEATRWVEIPGIGLQFQPSEVAKYTLLIAIAANVSNFGPERIKSFRRGVVPLLLLMAPVAILIYLQPNFSMLVILAAACFIMLVIAGVRGAQLSIMLFSGVGVGSVFMLLEGYRANRISSFQDPWSAGASGYQLRQSLIAFGSGGLWGQGLGSSRQKFLFLPYGESDMIFAIIAEELGLVGAGLLVIAYAVLYSHCFRIAMRCRDMGGRMLAAGCAALLCIQTIVNMCVATGLMPTTGQTLPFISSGATSMVVCMAVMGLILNVSRTNR